MAAHERRPLLASSQAPGLGWIYYAKSTLHRMHLSSYLSRVHRCAPQKLMLTQPGQGGHLGDAVTGCEAVRDLNMLQDAADRGAVQSVQVKGPSSSWQDLDNVWGASWEAGQVPEGASGPAHL